VATALLARPEVAAADPLTATVAPRPVEPDTAARRAADQAWQREQRGLRRLRNAGTGLMIPGGILVGFSTVMISGAAIDQALHDHGQLRSITGAFVPIGLVGVGLILLGMPFFFTGAEPSAGKPVHRPLTYAGFSGRGASLGGSF